MILLRTLQIQFLECETFPEVWNMTLEIAKISSGQVLKKGFLMRPQWFSDLEEKMITERFCTTLGD